MSAQSNGVSPMENTPRKLKILMLHGYTQSGPLFHAKTRALEKALHKAFPPLPPPTSKPKPLPPGTLAAYPGGVDLIYPSGPRKLSAADIPGYMPSGTDADAEAKDLRAWWQRNDRTGEYDGILDGFHVIAKTIREVGGVDGVIGFSQGGAAAAMVASLLESERPGVFRAAEAQDGLPYPACFLSSVDQIPAVIQPPLKFAVFYSAFRAPHQLYAPFYCPNIRTPTLHVMGTLDSVVEESRCLALADACVGPKIVYHPGGHFVPIGKDMVSVLVGFIRDLCREKVGEEIVDHMDMLLKI